VRPGPAFASLYPRKMGWLVGILGLLLTMVAVASIAELSRRQASLEQEVQSRTAELREQNKELSRLDRIKDEFLSVTTHDLRSPLATIHLCAETLIGGIAGELTEKQQGFLQIIRRQSAALSDMIGSVLDYARAEFGRLELHREPVGINELLGAVMELYLPQAEKKGICLSFDFSEEESTLNIDRRMIERALENLISNAIKFTSEGGSIAVSSSKQDKAVRIRIADTGVGLEAERIARVFDKFFVVESAEGATQQGMGLGLYVAKTFVEEHGGRIWAESAGLGKGTAFNIELPLA
jgi:signal transduction histidine kinase